VKNKHVFLNLFLISFPFTALASIVHRVTGVFLFLSLPVILYFFKLSLISASSFEVATVLYSSFYIKTFVFFLFFSFIYHMFFGIKHIILDLGFLQDRSISTSISIFFAVLSVLTVILGVLI